MFSRKTLLFATALSLLTSGAKADTPSCVSVDCAALGYTQTAAQCSGADTILKCPFDLSKVACNTNNLSLNDFILAKVQQYLPTPCSGNSSDYTTAVDISSCVPQGARLCGILSSDAIFSDLNIAIMSCMSKGMTISTVQDLVDLIISVLNTKTSNTCSNVVEVGDYETCTQYCASDSTKCIAKRSMTCEEAITADGGIILTSSTSTSDLSGSNKFYLTSDVTIPGQISSIGNSQFIPAYTLTPCQSSSTNSNPTLNFSGQILSTSTPYFKVKTIINYLRVSGSPTISTDTDLLIRQVEHSTTAYSLVIASPSGNSNSTITLGIPCNVGNYGDHCQTRLYTSQKVVWCGGSIVNSVSYGGGANDCTSTSSTDQCYHKSFIYSDCVPIE